MCILYIEYHCYLLEKVLNSIYVFILATNPHMLGKADAKKVYLLYFVCSVCTIAATGNGIVQAFTLSPFHTHKLMESNTNLLGKLIPLYSATASLRSTTNKSRATAAAPLLASQEATRRFSPNQTLQSRSLYTRLLWMLIQTLVPPADRER